MSYAELPSQVVIMEGSMSRLKEVQKILRSVQVASQLLPIPKQKINQ